MSNENFAEYNPKLANHPRNPPVPLARQAYCIGLIADNALQIWRDWSRTGKDDGKEAWNNFDLDHALVAAKKTIDTLYEIEKGLGRDYIVRWMRLALEEARKERADKEGVE
jgi:hypothetical protein